MNGSSGKRLSSGDGEEVSQWPGMNPELLALIFVRLPVDQMVRTVTLVCKSWLATVAGPYCWTEIDVELWCRKCKRPEIIDSAVRKLVRRSKCTFRLLSAPMLGNAGFAFAANCAMNLKVLKIQMSEVTDLMVERHAESLVNLTTLDISYCLKITSKGIEAFGKKCKSLIHLNRKTPPPDCDVPAAKPDDREAMAIANTMTGIRHLELGFGRFTDRGVDAILTKCKALTHLDIQGCWLVGFEGDLGGRCKQLSVYKSPWSDFFRVNNDRFLELENDTDEADDDSDDSEDSVSS